MKKTVIIILAVVLLAGSFASGFLVGKNKDSGSGQSGGDKIISNTDSDKGDKEDKENSEPLPAESEKTPVNVFFSPHTGSDETGNGSQENPYETLEKAKEHAKEMTPAENEEVVVLEFLMSVDVRTQAAAGVNSASGKGNINMIPFTGSSDGYYFKGEVVGVGCDTQKWGVEGCPAFSARYLLKGTDYRGKACSIFIENNGDALDKCTPTIITDSLGLSEWETANLRTIVIPGGAGVTVYCYRICD